MINTLKLVSLLNICVVLAYIQFQTIDYHNLQPQIKQQIQTQITNELSKQNTTQYSIIIRSSIQKHSDLKTQQYEILFQTMDQKHRHNYKGSFKFKDNRLVEHQIRQQMIGEVRFFIPHTLHAVVPLIPHVTHAYRQQVEARAPPPIQAPSVKIEQTTDQQQKQTKSSAFLNGLVKIANTRNDRISMQLESRNLMINDKQFSGYGLYPKFRQNDILSSNRDNKAAYKKSSDSSSIDQQNQDIQVDQESLLDHVVARIIRDAFYRFEDMLRGNLDLKGLDTLESHAFSISSLLWNSMIVYTIFLLFS